jgi:hypothetical protein
MSFKSKKITLPLLLCVLSMLFIPALSQAEEYETGSIAAKRAAEQREALAKKAEKRKKEKEAAAQKQAPAAAEAPAAATEAPKEEKAPAQ